MDISSPHVVSITILELGGAIVGLALLARIAHAWRISAIPLYLIAGLCFGQGGLLSLDFSEEFTKIGAEIGVLLLLFMLGLEYTGEDLKRNLKIGLPAGVVDLLLNFTPGFVAGYLLGMNHISSLLLGGVTYISSSGIVAKVLDELGHMNNKETPTILSILVLEDLVMAVYLPLMAVLLLGLDIKSGFYSVLIALTAVTLVLIIAIKYGKQISEIFSHQSDEIILLSTFGAVLLVAGIAQYFQVSAAVGAFLVGITLSGPIALTAQRLIGPLRDLFAAIFFFFFGLQIDPSTLPSVLSIALLLGTITAFTKFITGWWAAKRMNIDKAGKIRTGTALIARGEFSIVIAGLGANSLGDPILVPLSAAYVLCMAIVGPVLSKIVDTRTKEASI